MSEPLATPSSTVQNDPLSVIKGNADWRKYDERVLPNGVKCLLVQDKESKTTAMSVCVNVGASSDPRNMSGLAHFTEHMCFLGSERYPGENEYKRYLSIHGGRSNASTSMLETTYYFDVISQHAEKAVDIFSNFFISPLFSESGTSREVQAVDSENSKNLVNDGRRRLQIHKALADPDHSYSKFSTGNKNTLMGPDADSKAMREALLVFHKFHYRPENFSVVIVGPQDLECLANWVIPRFSSIQSKWESSKSRQTEIECLIENAAKDVPSSNQYKPAFRPELQNKWPVLLTTPPLSELRKLHLFFPLPPVYNIPDSSPVRLLGHLLGHEGEGSAFAVLQNTGLCSGLSAGCKINSPDQCLFQVDISLTEKGEQEWRQVVDVIFSYCRVVQATVESAKSGDASALENLRRIWDEKAKLCHIDFHNTSPGNAYSFAPGMAKSLKMIGFEKCLSAGYMLEENEYTFPLDKVLEYSAMLRPTNCFMERCSKSAWEEMKNKEGDYVANDGIFGLKKEKWYGVEYHLSELDEHIGMGDMDSVVMNPNQLHLPKPNIYIPEKLELCPELPPEAHSSRIDLDINPPNLIVDDAIYGRLWHRLDDRYALPKSSLTLLFRNPSVEHIKNHQTKNWEYSTSTSIHSQILVSTFSSALAQQTYDADIAGLYWSINKSPSGITMAFGGYSEKLSELANKIFKDFFQHPDRFIRDEHFVSAKDRVVRGLRTFLKSGRADSHAAYYTNLLISSKGLGVKNSLKAAEEVTLESLREHYKTIVDNSEQRMECLFSGNVSEKEARGFFGQVCDNFGNVEGISDSPTKPWIPGPFERGLKCGQDIELHFQSENPEEQNGAVLMTFQSSVPAYKGDNLSSPKSLKSTASLVLLTHMLREPLFDELRTKQQLGYIVSSYYDTNYSTTYNESLTKPFQTNMIDSIVINVLSRKLPPPEIKVRIDDFLATFSQMLTDMPESEIRDHSDALSKKLLKPKQKLSGEVGMHFSKIRRYGPEVLGCGDSAKDLPWDSVKSLAGAIQSLERSDVINVWNRVVKNNGARVVSHVYGKTFPMDAGVKSKPLLGMGMRGNNRMKPITSLEELFEKRLSMPEYGSKSQQVKENRPLHSFLGKFASTSRGKKASIALLGVGLVGIGLYATRPEKGEKTKR